jgi:hypothetical protein
MQQSFNDTDMADTSSSNNFYNKYGIHFSDLVELPNFDNYRRNYRIFYDKSTDRCFSLWQTPYKTYTLIENFGFITQDDELRKAYTDYIKQHF